MVIVPSAWPACHEDCVRFRKDMVTGKKRGIFSGTTLTVLGLFSAIVKPGTSVMELVLRIRHMDTVKTTYNYQHRFSFTEDSLHMERMK